MKRVLLCEDDQEYALLLEKCIKNEFKVSRSYTVEDAVRKLQADLKLPQEKRFAVVVIDLQFKNIVDENSDEGGFEILKQAIKDSCLEAIIHTAHGNEFQAFKAIKMGAFSYVPKNLDKDFGDDTIVSEIREAAKSHDAVLGLVGKLESMSVSSIGNAAMEDLFQAYRYIQRIRKRS
jgi:DNA-binding NtrC family response regulator